MKLDIRLFFEKSACKIQVLWKTDKVMNNLHTDRYIFLIVTGSHIFILRNASGKIYREKQSTRFIFNKFSPHNRDISEIIQKNIIESDRLQVTISLYRRSADRFI